MDRGREQVHAHERKVRRRDGRLLHEPNDLAANVELHDAEVARVVDVREQDLRRGRRRGLAELGRSIAGRQELVDEGPEIVLEHVVAEVYDEVVVAEEVTGDEHAVGEAARCVLVDVRDLDAEARTVAHGRPDLVAGLADLDDDRDVFDAGRGELLDAVEDDRLVGDRHELLRARCG